jgi:TetR/AcrR family transcriptional repressor of nem operon
VKVTREQMAQNRRKILQAAGRLFRARGFEAVTVAEIMKAAGLTHGGFYGHFNSKDELIAAALAETLAGDQAVESLARYADTYLSPAHCRDLAGGCPTAALASETRRQTPQARAEMTAGLSRQLDRLTAAAPGETETERRRAAVGGWSAMVGALVLARTSDDPALAEEILRETRAWIAAQAEAAPAS